jgi:hypothetical protein
VSAGPVDPAEYGGEWDEARVAEEGFAVGLDVWDPLTKAYQNFLGDGDMANAQLWSLQEAIRAEARREEQR